MESAILRVPPPPWLDEMPVMVSQANAVAITGRSRRTVQRWIRRGQVSDAASLRLLQAACYGLLMAEGWERWRVVRGRLVGPSGDVYRPEDLRADWINRRLVIELRSRCQELETDNAQLRRKIKGPRFRVLEA